MIIDIILLWLVNLFCEKQPQAVQRASKAKKNNENEDLKAFFFGTYPLEREDKSNPVNDDYDQGPNW